MVKAQAGLEYLMTYGWALVLLFTTASILWFLFESPMAGTFSSSDPIRIPIKAANLSGTSVEIQLQNATGGTITLTAISPAADFSGCSVNSSTLPLQVNAGNILKLNCTTQNNGVGSITINYTDKDGYQKNVVINGIGKSNGITQQTAQLFENYTTGYNSQELMYGNEWRGQTFTPSIAHNVSSVKILLYKTGSPGTILLSIRQTTTGPDLCTGTTNADTLPTDSAGEWREITVTAGCNLSAGTKYAIVARALAGDTNNYVSWNGKNNSSYPDGEKIKSSNGGTVWSLSPKRTIKNNELFFTTEEILQLLPSYPFDLMFEEWGIPS